MREREREREEERGEYLGGEKTRKRGENKRNLKAFTASVVERNSEKAAVLGTPHSSFSVVNQDAVE